MLVGRDRSRELSKSFPGHKRKTVPGRLAGLQDHARTLPDSHFQCQIIRGILLGEASMVNFGVTLAANLVYATVAFVLATRTYENERVFFRT
jgi:hypothetical protein